MLSRLRSEDGTAMALALLAIVVLSLIGLAVAQLAGFHLLLVGRERDAVQALDLAEAGLHRAVSELGSVPSWTGTTGATLANVAGSYTVSVAPTGGTNGELTVTSVGTVGRVTRTVRARLSLGGAGGGGGGSTISANWGLFVNSSLNWVEEHMHVTGTTMINGDFVVTGGSVDLDGSTTISGTVTDAHHDIDALSPIVVNAPVAPVPIPGISAFRTAAWEAIDTDLPGGSVIRNVDVKADGMATVIHVQGFATIGNLNIKDDHAAQSGPVIIIVDGTLDIDGHIKSDDRPVLIVTGGDASVTKHGDLENIVLSVGGTLTLDVDIDLWGALVAQAIVAHHRDLRLEQVTMTLNLSVSGQIAVLSWEEVTPP